MSVRPLAEMRSLTDTGNRDGAVFGGLRAEFVSGPVTPAFYSVIVITAMMMVVVAAANTGSLHMS